MSVCRITMCCVVVQWPGAAVTKYHNLSSLTGTHGLTVPEWVPFKGGEIQPAPGLFYTPGSFLASFDIPSIFSTYVFIFKQHPVGVLCPIRAPISG